MDNVQEVVVDETTPQEGQVPQPEVGPEGSTPQEEGVVTLPSDVETFVMPEKFAGKTAEEIARSYMELEKFKGTPTPDVPATPETPETPSVSEDEQYILEYINTGELSEESYAALEAKGMTRQEIADKMEFEGYKSKKAVDELVGVIGGIDNFTKMDEWAKEAFTPEQMAQYTQELASASKFGKQAILKDIYSQYTAASGEAPVGDVVHTNERQTIVTKGYTSQHELQADMADPRYGTDRSYTQAVEEKLAKSKIDF